MKKIFSLIMLVCMFVSTSFAQYAIQKPALLDNVWVGGNVGATALLDHSFDWANHGLQDYRFEWGLEAGKWITPVIGIGVNDELVVNLTGAKTAFDYNDLFADLHVNLSNLFGGYKGTARHWEFELIPAVGWRHMYCYPKYFEDNYIAFRGAVGVNYNFGSDRQWQINVRPGVEYVDRINHYNGTFDVRVGVTYRFKNHDGKHHFTKCDKTRTEDEYAALVAENTELKNRPAEVKEVIKEVPVETTKLVQNTYVVAFAKNDAELSDVAKEELNKIGENSIVEVDAYASPDGREKYNLGLSEQRANNVKAYLEGRGVRVAEARFHGAADKYSNRVAIVTMK